MKKELGILITSDLHGDHLEALAGAAARKQISLLIHLSGTAVRLCLQEGFQKVLIRSRVTVCHRSADRLGLHEQIERLCPGTLTSPRRPPLDVAQCPRRLVL